MKTINDLIRDEFITEANLSNKELENMLLSKRIIMDKYKKDGNTWYQVEFKSLLDLYKYLKLEPDINSNVFSNLSSKKEGRESFYELSYDDALEKLTGGYNNNIEELLKIKQELENGLEFPGIKRHVIKSVTGSRININSFIANDPKRYYKLERVDERKFITIHINMAYSYTHSVEQILNRGAIIYNLIKILEENNYSVKLDSFFLIELYDEIMYIKILLKDINIPLSISGSVYPFTSVAFFRRNIFRVMESIPVKNNWGGGYGSTISDELVKKYLNLPPNDIYVGTPYEMEVLGYDIYEDANNFLNYINMEKYVKVKIKK